MQEFKNEMYTLVDEEYLSNFSATHLSFMQDIYYSFYQKICISLGRKELTKEEFFTNMHYRRFQLYQLFYTFFIYFDGFLRFLLI